MDKDKLTSDDMHLIDLLEKRFNENMNRHIGIEWDKVQAKINAKPSKLFSLIQMEITGGEAFVMIMKL